MAPPTVWPGRIFLNAGTILYVGDGGAADLHAHHAVQLVWSAGRHFHVELENTPLDRRGVLIPASEPHTLDSTGEKIVLLLVESHGTRGAALDALARRERGRDFAVTFERLVEHPYPVGQLFDAPTWCDRVLDGLVGATRRAPLSSVSRRAIAMIEQGLDGTPTVAAAAEKIGISVGRLTHVFTLEVGIPFRRFVLWTRIKRAIGMFQAGGDLTRAAFAAGFSDAPHFSRTFRAMFGLSPSSVLPIAEVTGTLWSEPR